MDKVAFNLGSFTIHWYGVLVAVGFLAGFWTASRRGLRDGLAPEKVLDVGPWVILGAIIGSRALHVFTYWQEEFAGKPFWEIFMIHRGGLVFYGGFIGAALAVLLYVWLKKMPLWKLADTLAPSVALGHVFGRIGCLMNGCCFGEPTHLPWAIHFPADHVTKGAGVHPTQIYEALLNLGLYVGLAWFYRRKKFDGQVFALYLVSYALLRTFVEFFRGDYAAQYLTGWATPAHLISFGLFAIGALLLWKLPRREMVAKA